MKLGFEWKHIVLTAALTPAVMLTGCKTDGDGDTGFALAEPVAILDDASGSSDALPTAATTHITTQAAWEAGGFAQACPAPMDFDAHDVVVVALGEQTSGGHWVHIDAIQMVGSEMYVQFRVNKPGEDEVAAAVMTYPFHAVVIPKTNPTLVIADPTVVEGEEQP